MTLPHLHMLFYLVCYILWIISFICYIAAYENPKIMKASYVCALIVVVLFTAYLTYLKNRNRFGFM